MSVAATISSAAAASIRSRSKRSPASMRSAASSDSSIVSTASKRASLSSCRSLEYASGRAWRTPRRVVSDAVTRGAFARSNSAASGFFF